jgi:signal transduction histidine kinase
MTFSDKIAYAVYVEQVATVFRQMPIALAVHLVNATLVASVLTPIASRPLPPLWFVALVLVTFARWLLWRRYRSGRATGDASRWAALAACGSLFAGGCWGIGCAMSWSFVPAPDQALLVMVVYGMCAGAIVTDVSHLPTLLAFVLAATSPITIRFATESSPTGHVLGVMTVVFAAGLAIGGRQLNRIFGKAMRLQIELNEANLRLDAEMADHRTAEAALRQAQKFEAIGRLTGGIAHDFNNLLTVVIGNLLLARSHAAGNPALRRLIDGAAQSAERGVALIQRLLGFARRQRLDPRSIDLRRLVAGIEPLLRQTLGQAINLSIVASTDLAPAQVDANQLELAILILAINARDAMADGGSLQIGLQNRKSDSASPPELRPGEYAVISLADSGTGMDQATLAWAFDPFFTTKGQSVGAGFSLPMVQGFAAQSGGAVQLRSCPGAGTTVQLWLPQAEEPPDPPKDDATAGETEVSRGTSSILLCDDDGDVQRFFSEFLTSVGYAVHVATDGRTALRLLERRTEIELLIVDYSMPGMNGLETIRQARQQRPDLKPLLITGYAGAVAGNTADIPLLRKPFAPAELAHRVAEILAA